MVKKTNRISKRRDSKFDFLCEYRTYQPNTDTPFAHHSYYQLLYVLEGCRRIEFENGKSYLLTPSAIALIRPGVAYSTFSASAILPGASPIFTPTTSVSSSSMILKFISFAPLTVIWKETGG